jgi:serine/threonine protein kinase
MGEDEIKSAIIEAKILEKLDHPNIIKFIESFIIKAPRKSLCIVMDYADSKLFLMKMGI